MLVNNEKNDDGLECKSEDCPKNHMAVKKTDSNGVETCECVAVDVDDEDTEMTKTELAMIAGGVALAGLVVYKMTQS